MTQVIVSGEAPIDKPVIGWRNLFASGTVTVSSEAAGFEKENAYDNIATDYWMPTAGGVNTITVTFGSAQEVDYLGIARHTLGTEAATCELQYWDGAAWQVETSFAPADNDIILVLFNPRSATQWRLEITSTNPARIGVLNIGKRTDMEQGIFVGHTPEKLNRQVQTYGGITENGNFLPSNVVRQGTRSQISVTHIRRAFVLSEINLFMRHAEKKLPFFWAWNPTQYPDHAVWAKATDAPSCTPQQSGAPDNFGYWQFSVAIQGVLE